MDEAYVRENPPPKQPYKIQETLHFRLYSYELANLTVNLGGFFHSSKHLQLLFLQSAKISTKLIPTDFFLMLWVSVGILEPSWGSVTKVLF